MAIKKYAALQVLSARIYEVGQPLVKDAHRHTFNYVPEPGFLYVRSRAISSRTNDNWDTFPAEQIKLAWRTFIGKPVFVNHHNEDHRKARGVVIDAALHEDSNPDGTPDTWVEVLMMVDAVKYPKLCEAVVKKEIERTSMGTDVAYSLCSFCGNKAATPLEYCAHIPRLKGRRIECRTANGARENVLVHEICYGLGFFENSLLVEDPADPTAYAWVDSGGIGVTASSKATVGYARHPGRGGINVTATLDRLDVVMQGSVAGKKSALESFETALRTEAMMCSACNPNYGFPEQLCSSHASMRKLETQWGVGVLSGDFQSGVDSTDILFPGRRTASGSWLSNGDEYFSFEDEGVGEGTVSMEMGGNPLDHTGRWEYDALRYDDLPARSSGVAPSLDAAKQAVEEYVSGGQMTLAIRHTALGEQKAPPQVDTLRDDICPVCSEEDGFNGDTCQVCGFVQPPKQFQDPDVTKAQEVDLRGGDIDGGSTTLECNNCGATFETGGTAKAKTTIPPEDGEDDDPNAEDNDGDGQDTQDDNQPPWMKNKKSSLMLQFLAEFPDPNKQQKPTNGPHPPANEPASNNAAKPDNANEDPAKGKPGEDGEDEDDTDEANLKPGDVCPDCGQGTLEEVDAGDIEDQANDQPDLPPEGDEDNTQSLVDKAQGAIASRRRSVDMPNQAQERRNLLLAALREQQDQLAAIQRHQSTTSAAIHRMAVIAGVEREPVFAALRTRADLDNSADAAAGLPLATDNVTAPGAVPAAANTGVTPAATTDLSNTNVSSPTQPFTDLVDVTAPVAGTDAPPSVSDANIVTEVRVGTPDETKAFSPIGGEGSGWTAAQHNGEDAQRRFMASIHLAQLQAQAGLTTEDHLVLGQQINDDASMDLASIETEAATLKRVVESRQRPVTAAARTTVPSRGVRRVTPSLTSTGAAVPPAASNPAMVSADEFNW